MEVAKPSFLWTESLCSPNSYVKTLISSAMVFVCYLGVEPLGSIWAWVRARGWRLYDGIGALMRDE